MAHIVNPCLSRAAPGPLASAAHALAAAGCPAEEQFQLGAVTEGRGFTFAFTTNHNPPQPPHHPCSSHCLMPWLDLPFLSYSSAYKSFEASLPPDAIHPAYTRHTNLP